MNTPIVTNTTGRRKISLSPCRGLGALLLAWGMVGSASGVAAQEKPPARKSIFGQVVGQPTGENGYEELVLAADVFAASPKYEAAQNLETPLSVKREVLKDRYVVRALWLLRAALNKPVFGPRQKLTYSTLLPELTHFRALARLLANQQYVFLADGKVPEAIGNARLAIRFSNQVQQDTLIHGLVGLAICRIALVPLAEHLDQLSARDCEVVYRLALEWLALPNPQERIFAGDSRWTQEGLTEVAEEVKRKGVAALTATVGGGEESRELIQVFPTEPAAVDRVVAEARLRIDEYYQRVARELKRPPWERAFPALTPGNDVATRLANMLIPSYENVDVAYTREMARMRLLACEVAIRRYRWEHNRLPDELTVLRLGELTVDPFTGRTLEYVVNGNRFTLSSAGTLSQGNPNAVNGRVPVMFR